MTARDIRYGRQGGRVVAWQDMEGDLVRVTCQCADVSWWLVIPTDVGKACWTCGAPLTVEAAAA